MEGPKKKVGILGGSFDPPTLGHMQMAAEAINLRHVDEVWMVPCGDRIEQNVEAPTPAKDRYNMTKLLIENFFPDDFPVKVSDIEISNGKAIPTYNLMQELSGDSANSDCDFYFIIGSDLLKKMRTWEFGEKLAEEIKFIIFIRQGIKVTEDVLPKNCIFVMTTFVASNSTPIRNRIIEMRNPKTSEFDQPVLQRRVSSDRNQSFSTMYELDIGMPLRTIPEDDDCENEGKKTKSELDELYLGIYGVVDRSVIQEIKDKEFYLMKQEKQEENTEPSTPFAVSEESQITVDRKFEISVGYGE